MAGANGLERGGYNMSKWAIGTGLFCLLNGVVAHSALAGPELSFKSGISTTSESYPYAFDSLASADPIQPILAPFGGGPFAGAKLTFSDVYRSYDLEIEANLYSLVGSSNYGFAQEGGDCTTYSVRDLISLSHVFCMSGAETKSVSGAVISRVSLARELDGWDLTVLGGIGSMAFANEMSGRMFYDSEASAQIRQNTFDGTGISLGVRHQRSIGEAMTLKVEGFAGFYNGQRKLLIENIYTSTFGTLEETQSSWVRALDISVSVGRQVEIFGFTSDMEIGASFAHIDDVLNTANYNGASAPVGPDSPSGSRSAGVSSVTLFLGSTFQL